MRRQMRNMRATRWTDYNIAARTLPIKGPATFEIVIIPDSHLDAILRELIHAVFFHAMHSRRSRMVVVVVAMIVVRRLRAKRAHRADHGASGQKRLKV